MAYKAQRHKTPLEWAKKLFLTLKSVQGDSRIKSTIFVMSHNRIVK